MTQKLLRIVLLCCCLSFWTAIVFANTTLTAAAGEPGYIPEYDEEVVINRLKKLSLKLLEPRYNTVVKGYIKGYVLRNREKAERILAPVLCIFPFLKNT